MGKSIRSKRQKQLRTIKRKALGPSETLKVIHNNAKLVAFHKRTADLDKHDTTAATKDENNSTASTLEPIDPILLPPKSRSFAHSHPKPRDPADPTIRPYPRGRPREQQQAGRVSFQQALDRERRGMEDVDEVKEAEGGEGADAENAARVKVEAQNASGDVVEVSMLSDDEDGNMGEVSYVPLGQPARAKRANKRKGKTTRGGKKISRSTAVVANWKRLGGGKAGLVS